MWFNISKSLKLNYYILNNNKEFNSFSFSWYYLNHSDMLSAFNRINQMSKLMSDSLNDWNNHSLISVNIHLKPELIHISNINCLDLVFSLCAIKLIEELANIIKIHGLLSLRFNWLVFCHDILWMSSKSARWSMLFNCRRWTATMMASSEDLIGSLCNSFVMMQNSNAMKTLNISA